MDLKIIGLYRCLSIRPVEQKAKKCNGEGCKHKLLNDE